LARKRKSSPGGEKRRLSFLDKFKKDIAGIGTAGVKRPARPELPQQGPLEPAQRWKSLLWAIDSAQAHGDEGLRGLAVALARLIQADSMSLLLLDGRESMQPCATVEDLLWAQDRAITADGRSVEKLLTAQSGDRTIELASTAVIANIWQPSRLIKVLDWIGEQGTRGAWKQDRNHHAVVWHPWPLVWVTGGNHSTTAATLKGGGKLVCDASRDASPLLRAVTTDGIVWRNEEKQEIGKVRSLPMAGIIEIGRRLIGL
jgi:hypothetical protein